MSKFILKMVDENADELASTVTYEFTSDNLDTVLYHLAKFLQGSGYSYIESLNVTTESDIYVRKDDMLVEENQKEISDLESAMARASY